MKPLIKRNYIIGSEWLYFKLYTGRKTSDYILTDILKDAIQELIDKGLINKWFFIRYADPHHHLRIRFQVQNPENIGAVITFLYPYFDYLVEKGLVWNLQLDTYKRELERYGSSTMELSEQLFFVDSRLIVDFLTLIEGDEGEEIRWLFSLTLIDTLLSTFNLDLKKKLNHMKGLKEGFAKEFNMDYNLKRQLDDKFRRQRKVIEDFFIYDKNKEFTPIYELLEVYSSHLKAICEEITSLTVSDSEISNLLDSFIHMSMNRLFISKNRLHEMVCYDFLYRYYRSLIARKKNQINR